MDCREIVKPEHAIGIAYDDAAYSGVYSSDWRIGAVSYGVLTPGKCLATIYRNGKARPERRGIGYFCSDLRLGSPVGSAYDGIGWSAGHLWPAHYALYDKSGAALSSTFYTRNVAPQSQGLNISAWLRLEDAIFDAAEKGRTLAIATGPLFNDLLNPRRTPTGLAIPDGFWKIVAEPASQRMACYVMPNEAKADPLLAAHWCPLQKLAHLTGLLFPRLAGFVDDPCLFLTPSASRGIAIENLENGDYVLLEDYIGSACDEFFPSAMIRVPRGFVTDFGSVPKIFWNIFPPVGTFRDACFLRHDWLYATEYYSWEGVAYKILPKDDVRAEIDWRFLCMLQAAGDWWISRNSIYSAVRINGGFAAWDHHTLESVAKNRSLLLPEGIAA